MNKSELAKAFVAGREGRCHNAASDGSTYVLHASPIIRRVSPSTYQFYWHRYYTRTTAAHMNEVLRLLGSRAPRVSYAQARDSQQDFFVVEV